MSGPYAENSGQGNVLAARMAIRDFGGTMFGKPIELVNGDLQNKVDIGMAIARKWFDIEHVDAILGMGSSGVRWQFKGWRLKRTRSLWRRLRQQRS